MDPLVSLKEKTDDDTDAASVVNSNSQVRKMRTDLIANIIRLTLLNGYGYCSGSEKNEKKVERKKAAICAH